MKAIVPILVAVITGSSSCDFFGGEAREALPGAVVFNATRLDQQGNRVGDGNVYVMELDGSGLQQLTHLGDTAFAVNPAWSPDGRTIAFATSVKSTTLGPSLYLMDADGSNLRPFKRYPWEAPEAMIGWDPSWSPNGDRLAFSWCWDCELGGRNSEISVVKVAGEDHRPEDEIRLTDHPAPDAGPIWSPDGRQIAFASGRDYPGRRNSDLYLIDADGSNLRRLTESGNVAGYAWSPEGDRIAVLAGETLFLLSLQDRSLQPLEVDLPRGYDRITPMDWPVPEKMLLVGRQSMAANADDAVLLILDPSTGRTRKVEIGLPVYSLGRIDWFVSQQTR